jgi:hypothetical protein
LDGRKLDVAYGVDGIESSFYMTSHDIGNHTSLSIRHREGRLFTVAMRMEVDFHGYYGNDANPAMSVYGAADIPFTRLIIVSDNLFPKPLSSDHAKSAAAQFVDLHAFSEPERDNHGFILRPRI